MVHKNLKYFVDSIQSKIKHIINTAERKPSTIGLGGNPHYVRTYWKYKYFIEFYNKYYKPEEEDILKFEKLFPNGIVIVLQNEDYFKLKESENFVDKFLVTRLGSDSLLSSIILIQNEDSGKKDLTELITKLKENKELEPLSKKDENKNMCHTSTKEASSNSFWKGHYAINVSGGKQTSVKEGIMHLANPIYEYSTEEVANIIEYQITYLLLCCKNAEKLLKDSANLEKIKKEYAELANLDISKFGVAKPLNDEGVLQCCIIGEEINAEEILGECEDCDTIQYCHISSKSETDCTLVDDKFYTTFRPYNISWGKKWANLAQSDRSVEDTRLKIIKVAERYTRTDGK
jgi:hypothetical protein